LTFSVGRHRLIGRPLNRTEENSLSGILGRAKETSAFAAGPRLRPTRQNARSFAAKAVQEDPMRAFVVFVEILCRYAERGWRSHGMQRIRPGILSSDFAVRVASRKLGRIIPSSIYGPPGADFLFSSRVAANRSRRGTAPFSVRLRLWRTTGQRYHCEESLRRLGFPRNRQR
jgi:hypothetical protein